MGKIGILTFHYSNNYGAVLQCLALQKTLESKGFDVEVLNYIPSNYKPTKIINSLGISKNIFKNTREDLNIIKILKKIKLKKIYNTKTIEKFNKFRELELNLGKEVDENSLKSILCEYEIIIVGSDQVWNPSQRNKPEYFLDFGNMFNGKKISYAADSTNKEIDSISRKKLEKSLNDFYSISVRNKHSYKFVKSLINKDVPIVADPTILYDFENIKMKKVENDEYILVYVLGKEIKGSHEKAIEKIKKIYGSLPVYSIKIPTMNFKLSNFADKVFYDLGPDEWLKMFNNAKFIYTDSFHGVLFSLKYHKPFLAYYSETMRATRFIDLGKRYNVQKYIIENVQDIDKKKSLVTAPDFNTIDKLLKEHKKISMEYLEKSLS